MLRGFVALVINTFLCAQSISLEEILEHASQNAFSLKMKQTDAAIEKTNIGSAEAGYYPSLNVSYNAQYNKSLDGLAIGSQTVGGVTISNRTEYQSSVAFGLNYDLYHFGATDKKVEIAISEFAIKKMQWCSDEKELHLKLLEYYTNARKADVEQKYKKQMLDVHKELYVLKERLYEVGRYSKIDLGDEAISIISMQRDIEDVVMGYKENLLRLSQLSHKKLSDESKLLPLTLGIQEGTLQAYKDTTEGIISNKKIQQKKDEISLQFRQQLPSLSLSSNYYFYESHPTSYEYTLSNIDDKSWNVGLSLRYNIFEGFKHSADKERLQLELYRLEQQREEEHYNYDYETESKRIKIATLKELQEHEENLLEENYKKRALLQRLKKARKIDSITKINAEYQLVQRALSIQMRKIDSNFETVALSIQNRGTNQCSQH